MKITSAKNPHVKNALKLRNSHHRNKLNRIIIENTRCIDRALTAGVRIVDVFACRQWLTEPAAQELANRLGRTSAAWFDVPPSVYAKMAYRRRPEGLLAVAERPSHALDDLPVSDNGLYILAENLEKPGNLGAILRSADAVSVAGLILCDRHTDVYNPNAITASTGTVFAVPIAEAPTPEALAWLRAHGIAVVATVCDGGREYTEVDLTGPVAIALGAEHEGLSEMIRDVADVQITIAMGGIADSLNVAATATVCLFEAARQRRGRDKT